MSEVKSFRDLLIWQRSMELSELVYEVTRPFPVEERYGLTSQLRRAVVSIPSNIAEGYGRQSRTEYSRFLKIAWGSLYELQTQLDLAKRLGIMDQASWENLEQLAREIERMTTSLINKLS